MSPGKVFPGVLGDHQCKDIIKGNFDAPVKLFKQRLAGIRTGRANAAILDSIQVDGRPLVHQAAVSIASPQMLEVRVWNPDDAGKVEKAILTSPVGLVPQRQGAVLRIPIPSLSEERGKELIKLAKSMAEEARVAVRMVRRQALQASGSGKDKKVENKTVEAIGEIDSLLAAKINELTS